MAKLGRALAAIAAAALLGGEARAEEKHGVAVYPGAKYDAATSQVLRDGMKLDAGCYRTGDEVGKVVAFYEKQPGLKALGKSAEGGMFRKGDVDVTIQNPWMDMKTGALNKDTLVTIVKQK